MGLRERFEKFDGEYMEFERVRNPLAQRPDLAAFLLLEKLVPEAGEDIVSGADHDQIWLGTNTEALDKAANDDDILTLVRCGVRYCDEYECLAMWV